MRNTLRFGIISLLALIAFSMSACDNGIINGGENEKPGVVSVRVAPKTYIVYRGYRQSFIAAVSGTSDRAVTWSIIEQEDLHADTVIGQDGKLSVSPDEEQTTLTIKAALAADETIYGTATVSIPAPTVIRVEISVAGGVVIYPWYTANKRIDVDSGKTELFQAKVVGENFPGQDVEWSMSGAVSPGTTFTEGLLTVSPDEPEGTVLTIKAASMVDREMLDRVTVTVQPPTITYFRVVPSSNIISASLPVKFTVTVLGSGNIQGLYTLSDWEVKRSDNLPIAQDVSKEDPDDPETIVTTPGTKFDGNTLHLGPDENLGHYDEETDIFTPLPNPITIDVKLTLTTDLAITVPHEVTVSLTPEFAAIPTSELRY